MSRVVSVPVVLMDTITRGLEQAVAAVVVTGSHGGIYAGVVAAKGRVRAVIFNDAGVGRDQAGVGALDWLSTRGIAACTVGHDTCRIGEATDAYRRGVITRANSVASGLGVEIGTSCADAAGLLRAACWQKAAVPPEHEEARRILDAGHPRRIVLVDSAALVAPQDEGQVVVTGSHGGLIGGDRNAALKADAFAAVFNDAGVGADDAGIGRLAALQERDIAAFTVSANSARIGDAGSSYYDGIISYANERAIRTGAVVGASARAVLDGWARQ